ncbi:MAG: response regulator [Chloroflexi bacterium]|nr:response regulator [Chloroflexota bacterium]
MGYSVLIVEDDRELSRIYRNILERANYTVHEANNGAEALQVLPEVAPDILLIDMLMPMLGGEALLQRIRQMPGLGDMRVVVLTAYPRFREKVLYLGVDEFLVKPIKPGVLLETLANVMSADENQAEGVE